MDIEIAVQAAAGQAVYLQIPASSLRVSVDELFPYFAKYPSADVIGGGWHRYKEGHDLIVNASGTFYNHGVGEGFRHVGHIVLTDFPTKAGIPIPGFSQSGLGHFLTDLGISKGWLNVNICDSVIGILAVQEGHGDLLAAIHGNLDMSVSTLFDTYVEGTAEILVGTYTQNPILVWGGIENWLAGIVSTWQTYTTYVDPLDFFGHAFGGAIIGSLLSYAFAPIKDAPLNAGRGAIISAFSVINPWFAVGAAAYFLTFKMGMMLRERDEILLNNSFYVDHKSLETIFELLGGDDPNFRNMWESTEPKLLDAEIQLMNTKHDPLSTPMELLDTTTAILETSVAVIDTSTDVLDTNMDLLRSESRLFDDK